MWVSVIIVSPVAVVSSSDGLILAVERWQFDHLNTNTKFKNISPSLGAAAVGQVVAH